MTNEDNQVKSGQENSRADSKTPNALPTEPIDTILENLLPFARGIDISNPEASTLPRLNLGSPLNVLGREFGMLSRGANLFRRNDEFVTVDFRTGEVRPMPPERFCSYAEKLAWTFKVRDGSPVFSRLGKELAGVILNTDDFREHIRELRAVYEMRLPAWRDLGDGPAFELLAPGYDPIEKVFIVGSLPYDENLNADAAAEWLLETLGAFPWAEAADGKKHAQSRSLAAHVVAMLAPYCALLLGIHARRLMLCYLANQPGSGKTLLGKMALAPVHGEPVTINADQRPDELEKIVSTAVLEQRPYLFLDDVRSFRSPVLNMLLTSGRVATRIMGQSKMSDVVNAIQLYVTGNGVDIGPELARRSLIVDLFCPTDATKRQFPRDITDDWLYAPETRAQMLAALWALLRDWRDTHKAQCADKVRRAGFEQFSSILGSIVVAAGFANPFGDRESIMGGDEESTALRELLKAVASSVEDPENPPEFNSSQLAQEAERLGLLEIIAGHAKDSRKALGHQLKLLRGRQFTDSKGRLFEFGRRRGSRGAIYPLRFIEQ